MSDFDEDDNEDKCTACGGLLKWLGSSNINRVCKKCYQEVLYG